MTFTAVHLVSLRVAADGMAADQKPAAELDQKPAAERAGTQIDGVEGNPDDGIDGAVPGGPPAAGVSATAARAFPFLACPVTAGTLCFNRRAEVVTRAPDFCQCLLCSCLVVTNELRTGPIVVFATARAVWTVTYHASVFT